MKSLREFEKRLKNNNQKKSELEKKLHTYQEQLNRVENEFNKLLLSDEETVNQEEALSNKMAQLGKAIDMVKKQLQKSFSADGFKNINSDLPEKIKEDLKELRNKNQNEYAKIVKELETQKEQYYQTIEKISELMKKQTEIEKEAKRVLIKFFSYSDQQIIKEGIYSTFAPSIAMDGKNVNISDLVNPAEIAQILSI
jgi:chromosome segregation ATPase